jgi:hypothetical protein
MKVRASLFTAMCLFAACIVLQPAQGRIRSVPVMIGGERDLDACGAVGVVSGLDPKPASTLSVRSGPGPQFDRIDRLTSGTRVWLCDRKGPWVGVVYGPDGQDCGVSRPIDRRRPYTGPCASGWVFDKYVSLLAG